MPRDVGGSTGSKRLPAMQRGEGTGIWHCRDCQNAYQRERRARQCELRALVVPESDEARRLRSQRAALDDLASVMRSLLPAFSI